MPNKLNRWMKLINILHSRNGMSVQDLQDEFEVGERTIRRDIGDLKEAGYPIECKMGIYTINQKFSLRTLYLGDSEAVALLQTIDAFNQKGFPFSPALGAVREKIVNCLSPQLRSVVEQRLDVADIDLVQPCEVCDKLFSKLEGAATAKRQVKIKYNAKTSSREIFDRVVDPYGLVFKEKAWYLVAFCHTRNEIRLFRPDRISEIEVLETVFSIPEGFCLESFFENSWQIGQGDPVNVKIRFLPHIAQSAKLAKYHPLGKYTDMEDGSVLYEVTVKGLWEISRWALSFGPGVEVLEPLELREQVTDMLARACDIYKN
ncbi:hypothetical protein AXX12_12540 [Anaerosporomusa subterranea]|uniref:HTH deoR-type domain-containing protein n=1 Tax=Anaerosporomusa subterranea TaxID=1794912 RepID=A0A154BNS6_ANASB|nr:YafY family protein [Anaerosporomusa subterranea]KYZ75535.1 hypothetical protein AXX12_12540 [Anaerosporomusa subterranea]